MSLPNPGSDAAIKVGCTCPVMDNNRGSGITRKTGTSFWYSAGCPLHGLPVAPTASEGGEP